MISTISKIHSLLTPAERKGALGLLSLMVIGGVLETLGIGLVIPVIALMTRPNLATDYPQLQPLLESLGSPTHSRLILMAMWGLVGIYLIKNLFLAFLVWRQTRFAFGVQTQLSQRLFAIYLRQPYTFHLQRNSAQLIRNTISEVAMCTAAIISALTIVTEILVLSGIAILLLVAEPLGALIVVVVLGGAAWCFYRITRARVARWGKARQYHEGLSIQHLKQGLGGVKDVKLLGREDDFLMQFRVHSVQVARVSQFQATLQQLPRLWLELLAVAGLAALVLSMVAQGREMASIVPMLGLFAAASFRLIASVHRVLAAVQSLRYALPGISTLHDELKLVPDRVHKGTTTFALHTDIQLSNVSFTYPSASADALGNLSLSIRKGESVGFVGPSGSGKSTLVDVILGLLTPIAGQVMVDGQDIQQGLRAWQDQIGYVPQSIYLTDDTLRRNVAFGVPNEEIDDAAVMRAIKAAQLDEFVASLPNGLDSGVGERGIRLSGGQRQRIGIARALYHDPALLVLDEATSALDTITEREVMAAITALKGSKTILIVAHRLSTVEHCDRLYRLDHGKFVAEGTSAEIPRLPRTV
jgi:ABC-type multidrug transport system fused ATPase/permease subunit